MGAPIGDTLLRSRVTAVELRLYPPLGRDLSCVCWLVPWSWVFAVDSWRFPNECIFFCVLRRTQVHLCSFLLVEFSS